MLNVIIPTMSAILEPSRPWATAAGTRRAAEPMRSLVVDRKQKSDLENKHINLTSSDVQDKSGAGQLTSPPSGASSSTTSNLAGLDHYIALGCLFFNDAIPSKSSPNLERSWAEMIGLPDEVKSIIGNEASRLLDARWIRLFLHHPSHGTQSLHSILRVYLLPEDWNRRFIDRNSKSLKTALRQLLFRIDTSPGAWAGDRREADIRHFDPLATAENFSLYYLFNKLPSPAPDPASIKCRYTRKAVRELLASAASSLDEECGEQPLAGLRTILYPYQARSASLMLQREAAPQLQLDPRLEVRTSPDGKMFYFGARDGSALLEPRYYEANRGGILAETMGLGKTLISLAVILTTKGHYPQIPAAYLTLPPVRPRVGRLIDMVIATSGRRSIPARSLIEHAEWKDQVQYTHIKEALDHNIPFYEIPSDVPRMNRNTTMPPPRQLVLCSSTIIVVPRNLLHQWQSEIQKHVFEDGLKVLVVDNESKRSSKAQRQQDTATMKFVSELPAPTELMRFDVVLFTRSRFEKEITDGTDKQGRRAATGVSRICNCPYIGSTRLTDCNCVESGKAYQSPLMKLHWLRIIIDEGHSFSSSSTNAVLVAKQIHAERRWVVSGTPAKNLVGVELELATDEVDGADTNALRESAIEQRKAFNIDDVDSAKSAKALGSLASNFLMVRPWCDSTAEGRLDWDEYIYRHEEQYRKTYSGFSSCFLRTLEGLVVKTRPEDVEKDIVLPPMTHRVIYLKPCWYDKMTANLFVQVLRANAITSERSDVDYLFHKNSAKARYSLIQNLRQSNFTWTGFSLDDVINTLETTEKYLDKDDKKCDQADVDSLLESSHAISRLVKSEEWIALSKAHEVGMAVEDWPKDSEENFALAYPTKPTMMGITQLREGQLHVDSNISSQDPAEDLNAVGQVAKAKVEALAEAEKEAKAKKDAESKIRKAGVPSSCIGDQPLTSKTSPGKKKEDVEIPLLAASPARPKKRKLTLPEEQADLPADSPLLKTRIIATTSAKLTYLLDKVVAHQATEKIIIFYDGDNAAFYIAQCLEMLYINHRIYARTLNNVARSEYVALFNSDPDVRVLLIDVACGALGLNLNAASIVLIVNPINRPSIEAQAIKRAHRIGQDKKVTVETLVLENTIEHAIFKHAKKMSRAQHLEAKELEDDAGIVEIIQNAKVLKIEEDEVGEGMFAKLKTPQRVFGREGRLRFQKFGAGEGKKMEGARKKAKTGARAAPKGKGKAKAKSPGIAVAQSPLASGSGAVAPAQGSQGASSGFQPFAGSIFGNGNASN
ncbi:hypothetical protein HBH70_056420 [Parastagonospora nodorum]|nr:hypothetical protein HBH70_056420 [Parastagonospora nodorum]